MPNGTKHCQLAPSRALLGTPVLATSPSALSFWGCLAKPAPFAITPMGWSRLRGDAWTARGCRLHTSSLLQGLSGTGQAVSVVLSFCNNCNHWLRSSPAPAGETGRTSFSSRMRFLPIDLSGSQLPWQPKGSSGAAGGKPGWCSLPCAPAVPLPSTSHCPGTAEAPGLPRGDPIPAGTPAAPGRTQPTALSPPTHVGATRHLCTL